MFASLTKRKPGAQLPWTSVARMRSAPPSTSPSRVSALVMPFPFELRRL
ncbi:MAG: hypothetical protein M3Z25_00630 [Actinomycetota bacterium]|nr:hypothetical protein [Actinomycetota bacterium]